MPYYRCVGQMTAEDGNNIIYPIAQPSQDNKLYVEEDVSNIAYALGRSLKVSEMAGAVQTIIERGGIIPYRGTLRILLAECEIVQIDEG